MKNKSTLAFCTFFLLCCLSFTLNAQEQKSNNDFTLNVIKYSDKPNYKKEHTHVLELKNHSQIMSYYSILLVKDECSDNNQNKLTNKKESNINTEISFKDLNKNRKVDDIISLKPNESIIIQLKTIQKINAELDSWNCTTLYATKLGKNKSIDKNPKNSKSIILKTFVPNPINRGH